jgi:hypothetical protein
MCGYESASRGVKTYSIIKARHKLDRLSTKTTKRILAWSKPYFDEPPVPGLGPQAKCSRM